MNTVFKYLSILLLSCFTLTACSVQEDPKWSYSEKTATFKGLDANIKILGATKIDLSSGSYGVRVHYKVTNHTDETTDAYTLLLRQIKSITQNKKELRTLSVLGQDEESEMQAINIDLSPNETKEVVQDYKVPNLDSDIKINFQDDYSSEILATYSLSLNNLEDAPIYGFNFENLVPNQQMESEE